MFVRFFFVLISVWALPFAVWGHLTAFPVSHPQQPVILRPDETKTVPVQIKIPPDYFVYQEKTSLEFLSLGGLKIKNIQYPPGHVRPDPYFKKPMSVFEGEAVIQVTFEAPAGITPGRKIVEGLLKFQGCSDVLCYPEETHFFSLTFETGTASGPVVSPSPPFSSLGRLLSAQHFAEIFSQNIWIILLVVFLGGFLTSLTPCLLPVIPVTLMIIGVRSERHWSHNLGLSAVLVLGMAAVYALLGVLAVALGKGLGFIFQQKWVVLTMALLYFLLALSMFGLFEIHLPQFLRRCLNQIKAHGLWGAFVSGGAAGILAAPCAGPVVGALLLYVAGTQSWLHGFGLLFWYALGMGVLFLVLGTGYGMLEGRFHRWGFTHWVKRFLGLLLLLGSLFYLNTVFPFQKHIEGWVAKPSPIEWIESEPKGLEKARREGKVVLIDFYADWCPPCKELELGFFRRPEAVALLKQMIPVRIDATFMDEEVERVLTKYNIVGWPTIKFVAPDGQILEELTIVSYNPKVLLENMKRACTP